MKEEILNKYDGQYCSIDDIVSFIEELGGSASRKTVVWNVNDLVRHGKATRFGRGIYGFFPKPQFQQPLSEQAQAACSMLRDKFKYLIVTVTDTGALGQFMNLQPFSAVVVLETKESAAGAVLSALRKDGLEACSKKDFSTFERYISSPRYFVVRPELSVNPKLPQRANIRAANLEKILVDLVCDETIYGQYQGEELLNIYKNATESFAVNYSQLLKYAAARKKKAPVLEMLKSTQAYNQIRGLL